MCFWNIAKNEKLVSGWLQENNVFSVIIHAPGRLATVNRATSGGLKAIH